MDTKLLKLRIIECGTLVNTNVIDCRVKPNPREFGQAILSGGENAEADRIFHFFNDPFISRCVLIIMINTVSFSILFKNDYILVQCSCIDLKDLIDTYLIYLKDLIWLNLIELINLQWYITFLVCWTAYWGAFFSSWKKLIDMLSNAHIYKIFKIY